VNGEPAADPYVQHMPFDLSPHDPREEFGPYTVPPDSFFGMGDNRDNSLDSRYWGFVPRENILGTPTLIWWSYDAPTEKLASGNIDIDHIIDMVLHFFTKTRWKRTFQLVRGYRLE
ncbi:MAG TPA: signal peptidase I, partial [Bradyrhizobium sp.]